MACGATLVVGPVFPHEVVGFSGGNKYFFPGISSQEVINVSHWLGTLMTSAEIIGTRGITPVRAMIDEAVSLVRWTRPRSTRRPGRPTRIRWWCHGPGRTCSGSADRPQAVATDRLATPPNIPAR
jgi:hypothetical protein